MKQLIIPIVCSAAILAAFILINGNTHPVPKEWVIEDYDTAD